MYTSVLPYVLVDADSRIARHTCAHTADKSKASAPKRPNDTPLCRATKLVSVEKAFRFSKHPVGVFQNSSLPQVRPPRFVLFHRTQVSPVSSGQVLIPQLGSGLFSSISSGSAPLGPIAPVGPHGSNGQKVAKGISRKNLCLSSVVRGRHIKGLYPMFQKGSVSHMARKRSSSSGLSVCGPRSMLRKIKFTLSLACLLPSVCLGRANQAPRLRQSWV